MPTPSASKISLTLVGDVLVFTPYESASHLDDSDFASEAAIHLAEFQPNVTSTDDDQMFRHEVHIHH